MVVIPLLALPNLLGREQLYPWWNRGAESVAHAQPHALPPGARVRTAVAEQAHGEPAEAEAEAGPEHAIEENVLSQKTPYLNSTFFYIRAVIYMLAWLWLAGRLFGYSTAQ